MYKFQKNYEKPWSTGFKEYDVWYAYVFGIAGRVNTFTILLIQQNNIKTFSRILNWDSVKKLIKSKYYRKIYVLMDQLWLPTTQLQQRIWRNSKYHFFIARHLDYAHVKFHLDRTWCFEMAKFFLYFFEKSTYVYRGV